jgi:hypothetical protein
VDHVLVEIWSVANTSGPVGSQHTDDFGRYSFCVAPGAYYIKIPSVEFGPGAALHQKLSSSDPTNTQSPGDDDSGEDGVDDSDPAANGIRSREFVLATGRCADGNRGVKQDSIQCRMMQPTPNRI